MIEALFSGCAEPHAAEFLYYRHFRSCGGLGRQSDVCHRKFLLCCWKIGESGGETLSASARPLNRWAASGSRSAQKDVWCSTAICSASETISKPLLLPNELVPWDKTNKYLICLTMTDCLACFEGSLDVSNFQKGNLLWDVDGFFNNEAFQAFYSYVVFCNCIW